MTRELLDLRDGETVVVSMSGGKDSTALACALLRSMPRERLRFVFADTGWESADTYAYLGEIERVLGIKIEVAKSDGMRSAVLRHASFPSRIRRWCTDELKMAPLRKWLDESGVESPVFAVGVRAEESEARSKYAVREWSEGLDCETWRPILEWSTADVVAEIEASGLAMNPLYLRGYNRVGCYPCIFASKSELLRIGEDDPAAFERLGEIERDLAELRKKRNEEKPGRYNRAEQTMFIDRDGSMIPAARLVEWAKSKRFAEMPAPREGCTKWGFCENGNGND